jgi:hypothetical protein
VEVGGASSSVDLRLKAKEILPQTHLPGGREGDPQTSSETLLKQVL